ncbi:MAG: metallophosphoesterase, partial [Bacteroidaceae bacterium]|nr:metallophosphoesterase [Bacteroidaceae bacterium]
MAYDPENNPYIPGDPSSYDLKWVVDQLNEHAFAEESAAEAKASAEAAASSAEEASGYADDAEGYKDAASGYADDAAASVATVGPVLADQNDRIEVLEARMDTFASLPPGSTAGNAELLDIRVAYDSFTYPSAGDAVRAQSKNNSLELENFSQKIKKNLVWYQGARTTSAPETIGTNANRVTSQVIKIDIGDRVFVTGIESGHKFVVASAYDDGTTYDSGWKTSDYQTNSLAKSGKVFVNVATSGGNTPIAPSDISTLQFWVIKPNISKFQDQSDAEAMDKRINCLHKLINYRYDQEFFILPTDNQSYAAYGIHRIGTTVTIDNHLNTQPSPVAVALISNDIIDRQPGNNTGIANITNRGDGLVLKTGHVYKVSTELISGSATKPLTISVYRDGDTSSQGTLRVDGDNSSRIFTAESGRLYYLCNYYSNNSVFDEAKYNVLLEDISKVDNDAFLPEIRDTIDEIRAEQTEPCIIFPLLTDIHYGTSESGDNYLFDNKTIGNIKAVLKEIRADAIICMGDITHGNSANTKEQAAHINNTLRDLGVPYWLAIGNHDDNRYGTTFTANDMYAYYTAFVDNKAVFNPDTNGRDFYIDIPNFNIRFIILDSNTIGSYGFPNECVTWFENEALQTPAGCLAIVIVHTSPIAAQNYNSLSITNGTNIANAITAYQSSGKPIVQFYGHSHVDVSFTSPYLSIGLNCTKFENTNGDPTLWPTGATKPSRTMGTISEDCWDVVIIKPASRA